MPSKPLRPCLHIGCSELVSTGYCATHKQEKVARYDKYRGTPSQRGYDTRWRNYRLVFLRKHPLCVECERVGGVVPATVVDHVIRHSGDMELFWDTTNHQGLCKSHHDSKTAREDSGFGNKNKVVRRGG